MPLRMPAGLPRARAWSWSCRPCGGGSSGDVPVGGHAEVGWNGFALEWLIGASRTRAAPGQTSGTESAFRANSAAAGLAGRSRSVIAAMGPAPAALRGLGARAVILPGRELGARYRPGATLRDSSTPYRVGGLRLTSRGANAVPWRHFIGTNDAGEAGDFDEFYRIAVREAGAVMARTA